MKTQATRTTLVVAALSLCITGLMLRVDMTAVERLMWLFWSLLVFTGLALSFRLVAMGKGPVRYKVLAMPLGTASLGLLLLLPFDLTPLSGVVCMLSVFSSMSIVQWLWVRAKHPTTEEIALADE